MIPASVAPSSQGRQQRSQPYFRCSSNELCSCCGVWGDLCPCLMSSRLPLHNHRAEVKINQTPTTHKHTPLTSHTLSTVGFLILRTKKEHSNPASTREIFAKVFKFIGFLKWKKNVFGGKKEYWRDGLVKRWGGGIRAPISTSTRNYSQHVQINASLFAHLINETPERKSVAANRKQIHHVSLQNGTAQHTQVCEDTEDGGSDSWGKKNLLMWLQKCSCISQEAFVNELTPRSGSYKSLRYFVIF